MTAKLNQPSMMPLSQNCLKDNRWPPARLKTTSSRSIWIIRAAPGRELVSLGRLAAALSVVPGTVTTMVKALSEAKLVRYEPRNGVKLTSSGQKLALHVLRRHRLIELFLVQVLEVDWSEVHVEAEDFGNTQSPTSCLKTHRRIPRPPCAIRSPRRSDSLLPPAKSLNEI